MDTRGTNRSSEELQAQSFSNREKPGGAEDDLVQQVRIALTERRTVVVPDAGMV